MPVYDYVCNTCSDAFDTLVRSFSAADDVTCVNCDSSDVRRVPSRFASIGGLDEPMTPVQSSGGGCCGGSCGCGH